MKFALKFTLVWVALCVILCCFGGCSDKKTIDGVVYQPYGMFDEHEVKADSIVYRVVAGNVVWSIIGFETVIVPVWLIGYDLYEPIGKKQPTVDAGR